MRTIDKFVAGTIAIGLITAFGLHAADLVTLTNQAGKTSKQFLGTAING